MKTLLLVGLNVLWLACARAELGVIGARVTRDADGKVHVAISSSDADEQRKDVTIEEAAAILRNAKWGGSSVLVGIVAHGIPVQDYLPLLNAVSENWVLDLAFVEGVRPSFVNDNIKKGIEQNTPAQAAPEAPASTDVRLKMSQSSTNTQGQRTETRELVITADKPGFVHLSHDEGVDPLVAPLLPSPEGNSYFRKVTYEVRESGGQSGAAVFTWRFIAGPGEKELSETVELWNHRHISYDDFAKGLREIQDPTGKCLRAVPLDLAPLGDGAFLMEVTDTPVRPRTPLWSFCIWHPTYSIGGTQLPSGVAGAGVKIGHLIETDHQKLGRISQRDGKFIAHLTFDYGSYSGFDGEITPECPVDFEVRLAVGVEFPVVGVLTQEEGNMMPFLLKQLRKDLRGRKWEALLNP